MALRLYNFDKVTDLDDDFDQDYASNSEYTIKPKSRTLIVGASQSGKTNLMVNLLIHPKLKLNYDKIYVVCPTGHDKKYQWLYQWFEDKRLAIEAHYDEPGTTDPIMEMLDHPDQLPDLNTFDPNQHTVIIFDDCLTLDQKAQQIISTLWVRGRHYGITSFYLAQSYYRVPKLMRENTVYFIIFKPRDGRSISQITYELCQGSERFKDHLKKMKAYEYIIVDQHPESPMQYRKGFTKELAV